MREIIYTETSPGVMESAAERRARRIREKGAKKKRQQRAEMIDSMLAVALVIAGFVAYFALEAWAWHRALL